MKKHALILLIILLVLSSKILFAQEDTCELNLVNCIPDPVEETKIYESPDFIFYNDFNTWIPYCNSEPLKNPPITYIEVTFHVFLDDLGGNSNYKDIKSFDSIRSPGPAGAK